MATTEIVPTNDAIPKAWSYPVGTHYTEINEGSGGAPDFYYIKATNLAGDDNDPDAFDMGNPDIEGGIATQIVVHTYGNIIGFNTPELRVIVGGTDETQECNLPSATPAEVTNTFNGSWSEAQLAGLKVVYTADVPDPKNVNTIFTCWVIVTYTPSGWGHKIQGVANANIGKIMGVPKANITKVNGV